MKKIFLLALFSIPAFLLSQWESSLVYYNAQDRLEYTYDEEFNRIPDFSYAGYKNGLVDIPDIPVVKTISPLEGDNTTHINNALFEVALKAKDEFGFRGALLLEAGTYEIQGTIKIPFDGVILRGVGQESDSSQNTILFATGNTPSKRTVLVAAGGDNGLWEERVYGTTSDIVTDSVMVGERSFEVADASVYNVGDNIIIYQPCTTEWLTAIDFGGTHSDGPGAEIGVDIPWTVGSQPVVFNRYIEAIDGNLLTIDAPVYDHLIRSLSQSYVYTNRRDGIKTNIGIENLRIDIEAASDTDENHAWNAVDLYQVEDAWVKDCTFLHFGLSGVRTNTATRVTVDHCSALDPKSIIEGGKRYNFNVYTGSQLILFRDCFARNGRHHFGSNGHSFTSGVVFLNCTSSGAYTSSEGHRRWSQAMLYDNLIELDGPRAELNPRLLGLYNRGYYGTSHGWAVTHSVAWNCDVAGGDLIVQKPPTGQNYAIGCSGVNITGAKPPAPFDESEGFIEGSNRDGLEPHSLYLAQLDDRKKNLLSIAFKEDINALPVQMNLMPNFPNPFNPTTTITFSIASSRLVRLNIFDLKGIHIKTLANRRYKKGDHSVNWNGLNRHGRKVASGLYLYTLFSNGQTISRKMLLIK